MIMNNDYKSVMTRLEMTSRNLKEVEVPEHVKAIYKHIAEFAIDGAIVLIAAQKELILQQHKIIESLTQNKQEFYNELNEIMTVESSPEEAIEYLENSHLEQS